MLNLPRDEMYRMFTSTYDVHNVCNLKCEGCSYFVTDRVLRMEKPTDEGYDAFFRTEVARGVNYPIFSGAEPSLNQRPLEIAARHWDNGAVFTNGTKRINPDLPFRVVVSVWGGGGKAERLRGGNTYRKALLSAASDRRAMVFFTITRDSVEDLPEVAEDCAKLGIKLSFNLYSMSSEYARKLRDGDGNDGKYFRFSTSTDNLALTAADRERAAFLIDGLIDAYPGTVMLTKSLNDFMCRSETIHAIDPLTHRAIDCAILNTESHISFNYDLTRDERKSCSAPDFDCRDCRVLGAALATLLRRKGGEARVSSQGKQEFRELRRLMMDLYYWRRTVPAAAAVAPAAVAAERAVA